MIGLMETVASQYANSPILMGLIANFNAYIDPRADINDFYAKMWDIATAEGYGLDVWGRIVGVSRVMKVPINADQYFGFSGTELQPFNQGPFFSGTPETENNLLTDDAFRALILVKAMTNISGCSAQRTNYVLTQLFGTGGVMESVLPSPLGEYGKTYCIDNHDMTVGYVFEFTPTPLQLAILQQSGAVLRPSGVFVNVVLIP